MDIESNYFAFSEHNLKKLIKPELREQYEKEKYYFYHLKVMNYIQHLM